MKEKEEYIEVTLNLCLSLFSLSLILCASFLSSHIWTPWEGGGADLGSTPQP